MTEAAVLASILVALVLAVFGIGRFLIGFWMIEDPFAPDTDAYDFDEPPHGV